MSSSLNPEGPYAMDEAGAGSEEPGARRRFIVRVFGFASLQLAFTALLAAGYLRTDAVKEMLKENHTEFVCLCWFGVLSLCVVYWRRARRGWLGIVCLILLFLDSTNLVATVAMRCSTSAILFAGAFTAIMTLMFVCVSACTNLDITKYRVFVLIFLWIGIGCVGILSAVKFNKPDTREVELTLGIVGTLTFSLLLLYDVQTIMGGRVIVVKPDQTIYAIFQLHLAITLTCAFLMMLKFL